MYTTKLTYDLAKKDERQVIVLYFTKEEILKLCSEPVELTRDIIQELGPNRRYKFSSLYYQKPGEKPQFHPYPGDIMDSLVLTNPPFKSLNLPGDYYLKQIFDSAMKFIPPAEESAAAPTEKKSPYDIAMQYINKTHTPTLDDMVSTITKKEKKAVKKQKQQQQKVHKHVGFDYQYPESERVREQTRTIVVLPEKVIWQNNPLFDDARKDANYTQRIEFFRKACHVFRLAMSNVVMFDTISIHMGTVERLFAIFYMSDTHSTIASLCNDEMRVARYENDETLGILMMVEGIIMHGAEKVFPNLYADEEEKAREPQPTESEPDDHPF